MTTQDESDDEPRRGHNDCRNSPASKLERAFRSILQSIADDTKDIALGARLGPDCQAKVEVDGVGRIALPLCPEQVATVRSSLSAPSRPGHALVVDGSRVQTSPSWPGTIGLLATKACTSLGLRFDVETQFKGLVIQAAGDAPAPLDTPLGHCATLVVQLPAIHSGGGLHVASGDRTAQLVFDGPDTADESYYTVVLRQATCDEAPITSGHKLSLVYHIVRAGNVVTPTTEVLVTQARAAVATWAPRTPEKLVFPLDFDYDFESETASFALLQGRDKALADLLVATDAVDLHLATVVQSVLGEATNVKPPRRLFNPRSWGLKRRRYESDSDDSEDDGENAIMDDIFETSYDMTHWINERNERASLELDLEPETEVVLCDVQGDMFAGKEPVERDYMGWQGFDQPNLTETFECAVLVAWPRSQTLSIAGPRAVLSRAQSQVAASDTIGARATLDLLTESPLLTADLTTALRMATTLGADDKATTLVRMWAPTAPRGSVDYAVLVDALGAMFAAFPQLATMLLPVVLPTLCGDSAIALAVACPHDLDVILSSISGSFSFSGFRMLDTIVVADPSRREAARLVQLFQPKAHAFSDHVDAANDALSSPSVASTTILTSLPDINLAVANAIVAATTSVHDALLPKVLAGARHCATTNAYRCLAYHRLSLLPVDGTPPPVPTHVQSQATMPSHPHVQAFLRGPAPTMQVRGFTGIRQAREFAAAWFRTDGKYDARSHASALPVVSGAGKTSLVTLTKTTDYFNAVVASWATQRDEAIALRSLLRAS
ncbi:hypothetical protein SDRG_15256 [Saprolegnia diclina VS20]|uniref:Uncharacterized protein n=1 Tax=Saprolegnia diclina (strain VS20) TaxID=1156394 RepID=T0PND8_SAPDV|nr:hypothetical protein SDRG_15256 [Saprolegnia diclina VS20]EQC26924.1 hypothetical protein SDRG_15256 [Saprolegnia diclina VS20]|eukprot:XP_008619645.1 hypothetical protein SDRG_15256 [Saprolegnia diclina VS20]